MPYRKNIYSFISNGLCPSLNNEIGMPSVSGGKIIATDILVYATLKHETGWHYRIQKKPNNTDHNY